MVDGERFTIPLSNVQREYVSYYSGLYERADFVASDEQLEIIKKVVNSKETIIRLNGDKYYTEFTLSKALKEGIADTLDAYEGLKDEIYLFGLLSDMQDLLDKYKTEENTESNNN